MSSYSEQAYGPTLSWHATWAIEHVKSPKRLNGKIDVVAYWRNSKLQHGLHALNRQIGHHYFEMSAYHLSTSNQLKGKSAWSCQVINMLWHPYTLNLHYLEALSNQSEQVKSFRSYKGLKSCLNETCKNILGYQVGLTYFFIKGPKISTNEDEI